MATRTIARLFDSYADATAAVHELEAAGFAHDDVSLIAKRGEDAVAGEAESTETGSGAGTGATLGTLVGGGAGLLAGLGALAIPGLGPLVAAGWLVAALAGAGVGAATGGLLGALTGSGLSEEESHVYAEGVRRGGNLLTVRTEDSRAAEVEAIMQRHNAANADERAATYRAGGWDRYDDAAGVGTTAAATQLGARTSAGPRIDATLVGRAPDGTPGNPPGTMMSRAADDALGTNISGSRPEHDMQGTPGNQPGTQATRAADDALGTNISGARPQHAANAPDGTPGNPPGTKLSRGVDEVAGTNISGAHPENEPKGSTGTAPNRTPGA